MSVFYLKGQDFNTIEESNLNKIRETALVAPLRRARFCLHHSEEDSLHEMVIAFCCDSYVRPHRHVNKSESFHVIEGELEVVFFDDSGNVTRRIRMAPYGNGKIFLYRLDSSLWHTVIPLSDMTVIHEITTGPFVKEESCFPSWAPENGDAAAIKAFLERIKI